MSKARDSQRSKVYNWEMASIPGWQGGTWVTVPMRRYRTADGEETVYQQRCRIDNEMSLDECAALIAKVWAAYRPTHRLPKVTPGHMARQATGCSYRIDLPRWARQPLVVLHETAHSILPLVRWDERDSAHLPDGGTIKSVAWHGPEFVRLYIELLVRYYAPARGLRGELLRSARAAKIKIGSLQDCLKPVRKI
jgi:hypothetical protein